MHPWFAVLSKLNSQRAASYVHLNPFSKPRACRYTHDWRVWIAGIPACTVIVAVSVLLATRRVLSAPPVETLRET